MNKSVRNSGEGTNLSYRKSSNSIYRYFFQEVILNFPPLECEMDLVNGVKKTEFGKRK